MDGELVRPVPPYVQIADKIQADIASGKLKDGDRIPSARQIQADWNVAVATASRVQSELRSRGLVASVRGVGTVVRRLPAGHSGQERALSSLSRDSVSTEASRIISAELVPAPADVALSMGVDEGCDVVRRERVSIDGGIPVEHSVTWMPGRYAALAPELIKPERVPGGTFRLAAERDGQRVVQGTEEVTAGVPTPEIAEALGISPDTPVTTSRCWFRDDEGNVVEYGEAVRPGGRWASHSWTIEPAT